MNQFTNCIQEECVEQKIEKHVKINQAIERLNLETASIFTLVDRIKYGDNHPPCDPKKEQTTAVHSFDETLSSISSRVNDASDRISGAISELTAILF